MTEDSDSPAALPAHISPAADRFTPAQVQRILQRASEIDAHGEHASADELLRIAREAGIDLHAMQLAIAEVADEGGSDPSPSVSFADVGSVALSRSSPPDRDTLVPSILGGAGVGVVAGALVGLGIPSALAGLGIGGLFLFALVRAAQLGRKGALLEFEIQNLVTMALGAAAAVPFAGSLYDDDVAAVLMVLWIVTSVLGGGLVWWLGRDDEDDDHGNGK